MPISMPSFSEVTTAPYVSPEEEEAKAQASRERNDAWQSGAYGKGITIQTGGPEGTEIITHAPATHSNDNIFATDSVPGSILETARSNAGRPLLQHEITDTTLVTIEGCTMEALTAARMGYLHRDQSGEYTDPNFDEYNVGTAEEKAQLREAIRQEKLRRGIR